MIPSGPLEMHGVLRLVDELSKLLAVDVKMLKITLCEISCNVDSK